MIQRKTPADWTPDHIRRFWAYWSATPQKHNNYFSYQVGRGVVNFLRLTGKLRGKVLDYGCGPGYLLQHLLAQGVDCFGAEFSREAADFANQKFHGHPKWGGAAHVSLLPTRYHAAAFDVITCVETLEHLSDDLLSPVINEMRRLVKPGGIVLITTPAAENLEQNLTYCPFCEAEFHQFQHARSFSAESLKGLLELHKFQVLFAQSLSLEEFQCPQNLPSWKEWSLRLLYRFLSSKKSQWLDELIPKPFPLGREFSNRIVPGNHLCLVAEYRK